MISPSSGSLHLTLNGSHEHCKGGTVLKGSKTLTAPADNFILISVSDHVCLCDRGLAVISQGQDNDGKLLWRGCDSGYPVAHVLPSNIVTIQWNLKRLCTKVAGCLTVYFSFHPKWKLPPKLSSGLYNCSVDYYRTFQQHLDCSMQVDCEDGRDETEHCTFSSPACKGWVAIGDKCYVYVNHEAFKRSFRGEQNQHMRAVKYCASLNSSLVKFRSSEDVFAVLNKFRMSIKSHFQGTWVGVSSGSLSVPNMYRRSLIDYDKTVLHHSFSAVENYNGEELYFIVGISVRGVLLRAHTNAIRVGLICEVPVHSAEQRHNEAVNLFDEATFSYRNRNVSFTKCHNGQTVHMFLSCYPHYDCGPSLSRICTFSIYMKNSMNTTEGTGRRILPVPAFICRDGVTRLAYSLVCDFIHHCKDWSDEIFCQHRPCGSLSCSNGQCVSYSKRCDMISDCLDDSDEWSCIGYTNFLIRSGKTKSPALISFDGRRSFRVRTMNSSKTCPETHYRCPGEYNDCVPVYTRCNGLYDCLHHEDEEACENMTCPGYYRCFNSTVCLHADHLCDGWPHCPQRDDEWLCDMICPAQCLCQGHVFLCSTPFNAHLFPNLRYLDAKGSGVTLSDLNDNFYIVFLSLSGCSLRSLPAMTFLNLQFLDLSANNLTGVTMTAFTHLANLRTLSLARNPIDIVYHDPHATLPLSALRSVDLSHNKLTVFDSKVLSSMINVQSLNLSYSTIHTIHPNGFQYTPKLSHLYLAGNPIHTFSENLFKPLTILRVLSSQTYKLCCKQILPDHYEIISCDAPTDEISSCEDLLQSGTYRGLLWLIGIMSLLGNMICLVVRVVLQRTASSSGFHVFVTNLSTADLLIGVYIAIIGAADSLLRGKYLFYDKTWKRSVACKVAGFLSLLSCEVSALTIWLITLDRFIVLRFPFSSLRFERTSAAVASLITWLLGLCIACTPVLPMTSHWEFFGQTGICIPLPVNRQDFKGKAFSVGVFIVFNFVLFVLIAAGQIFIYWSVQINALHTDSNKVSRDLTLARRLLSVAVTDFLCWFPIGLCGLLSLADIPIPGEVNVAFAIFVLPLNASLNPFMYTFNTVMEKRRKSSEALLLQWLESRHDSL